MQIYYANLKQLTTELNLSASQPQLPEKLLGILSQTEIERLNNTSALKGKLQFAIGRILLKQLIAQKTNSQLQDIQITVNEFGKPDYKKANYKKLESQTNQQNTKLRFSLSHSGDFIVIAITQNKDSVNLGIDLERLKPEIFTK